MDCKMEILGRRIEESCETGKVFGCLMEVSFGVGVALRESELQPPQRS